MSHPLLEDVVRERQRVERDEKIRLEEQARIIKLLEGLDLSVFGRVVYSENRDELIALIKGETK